MLNLLHFREKNRQVPETRVDLGRRDECGAMIGASPAPHRHPVSFVHFRQWYGRGDHGDGTVPGVRHRRVKPAGWAIVAGCRDRESDSSATAFAGRVLPWRPSGDGHFPTMDTSNWIKTLSDTGRSGSFCREALPFISGSHRRFDRSAIRDVGRFYGAVTSRKNVAQSLTFI
jgi:hypothetical protein